MNAGDALALNWWYSVLEDVILRQVPNEISPVIRTVLQASWAGGGYSRVTLSIVQSPVVCVNLGQS